MFMALRINIYAVAKVERTASRNFLSGTVMDDRTQKLQHAGQTEDQVENL